MINALIWVAIKNICKMTLCMYNKPLHTPILSITWIFACKWEIHLKIRTIWIWKGIPHYLKPRYARSRFRCKLFLITHFALKLESEACCSPNYLSYILCPMVCATSILVMGPVSGVVTGDITIMGFGHNVGVWLFLPQQPLNWLCQIIHTKITSIDAL